MQTILIVFHILLALAVIGLVLMQHGKGADAGAAFGSGASATVFGARGSANFLSRATGILAGLFFLTSLVLAFFAMRTVEQPGLMEQLPEPPVVTVGQEAAPAEAPVASGPADLPAVPEATAPTGSDSDMPVVPPAPVGTPGG